MSDYVIVSLPFVPGADQQPGAQFGFLQRQMGPLGPALRHFIVPVLKVGTLDSLMEASDELTKLDPQLEGTVLKLASLLEEASGKNRQAVTMLRLNQHSQETSTEQYLKVFAWNSAQWDPKESAASLIEKLTQVAAGAEERVRVMLTEYTETKGKLQQASRKGQGNLAVKPLGDIIAKWKRTLREEPPMDTEFLTTMFIAVPASQQSEWESSYWQIHEFVCPQSSTIVAQDSEYILNSVVLFKKAADDFKMGCRKKKYVVREPDPDDDLSAEEFAQLQQKADQEKSSLIALLSQQFSLCYVAWIHAKALRIFVESMLKYGLPPKFVAVLLAVDEKKENEIRKKLKVLYSDLHTPLSDEPDAGALQYEYPYVSLKVADVSKSR